jgi:diguanylate cyclase (GGDEF)-like protein/PAS domain S-box-containing protein
MFVMILVASLVMASAMAVIAGRRHPDLQAWSLGLLSQAVAYILLALRGQIPVDVSIVAANTAISLSLALYVIGLHRIYGQPVPKLWVMTPIVVTSITFALLVDHYHARLVAGAALWTLQTIHLLVVVLRNRAKTQGRGQYMVASAATLFVVTEAVRLIGVLNHVDHSWTLTTPSLEAYGFFLSSLICTLLMAVGALTMVQERAELALAQSEARHRRVIDAASVGICIVSGGQFRFTNPKAAEILGRPPQDIVDHPFAPFIHPDDLPLVLSNHKLRLEGNNDDLRYETRMLAGERGTRWMEISGVAMEWHGQKATLNFLADVTERHQTEEHMRVLAWHDALTQLPNRRLFVDHLELALAASERSGRCGAVLFFDLDNFKPLNDSHGHAMGDLLLKEVARRLLLNIRPSDTAARFGGDEFVVLLTDLAPEKDEAKQQAAQRGEVIRQALGQPYLLTGLHDGTSVEVTHRCSATGGIAVFSGSEVPVEALIERADAAMYQAKEAGRNRVWLAQSGLVT